MEYDVPSRMTELVRPGDEGVTHVTHSVIP